MKMKRFLPFLLTAVLICTCIFTGCSKKEDGAVSSCPFASVTWETTKDEILNSEGNDFETYDSLYGGLTYSYSKAYDGMEGIVKYMFDDKDRLMCAAWVYSSDSSDDVIAVYEKIRDALTDSFGESGYNSEESVNSLGDVWYLEGGNIILSVMLTGEMKALQYAYLNPEVSSEG